MPTQINVDQLSCIILIIIRAFKGKMHILDKLLHYKIYALVRLPYELLNKCCLSLVVGQICNELGIS